MQLVGPVTGGQDFDTDPRPLPTVLAGPGVGAGGAPEIPDPSLTLKPSDGTATHCPGRLRSPEGWKAQRGLGPGLRCGNRRDTCRR